MVKKTKLSYLGFLILALGSSTSSMFGATQIMLRAIRLASGTFLCAGGLSVSITQTPETSHAISNYRYAPDMDHLDKALKNSTVSSLGAGMITSGIWLISKHPLARGLTIAAGASVAIFQAKRIHIWPRLQEKQYRDSASLMTRYPSNHPSHRPWGPQ